MRPRLGVLMVLLELAWLGTGCSRQPVASPTASAPDTGNDESLLFPRIGGVTNYAGSATCKDCHPKQYDTWHRSYHRTMTQLPTPEAVQADFNHVVLTNGTSRFILTRTNRQFWVHMESAVPGTPDHPAPEPVDVPLGLVTGSHHMQVFWLANGMGNCQIGFPFTWLIPEHRWVPRNSTFLRPPSIELRPETWNLVCSRCHATATQPGLDRAALVWRTQVEELGIACEACHGPAQRHVALERELKPHAAKTSAIEPSHRRPSLALSRPMGDDRGEGLPATAASPATNLFIVHPEKISPGRASQICGFCHSMKWWDAKEGWPERGFSFRPGDDLDATTPVMRPTQLERQPWLKPALERNPDLFRDFFWSDGMIRVSGRDYNGLIESPCYRGGQFSCLSCHTLHGGDPNGQLAENRKDNQACMQCHDRFGTTAALTAHTHHRADSSGSQCYNCHMPRTTYGVLKAIRSHQVSSPQVAAELATGRPNACNLCHLDKSLAWTRDQLAAWYPRPSLKGASSPRPSPPLAGEQREKISPASRVPQAPTPAIAGVSERIPRDGTRASLSPVRGEGRGEGTAWLVELKPADPEPVTRSEQNAKFSADETAVADSVRLALSGDAGQRVLMAWHLGWAPAWQASGKDWIPPVLGQLLDDPYAAVRCVAERSLRRVAPNLIPAGYDYTIPPESRPPARTAILQRWQQATARVRNLPAATLVRPENPKATQEDFQRLASQRDDRPVRLRE